MRSLPLILLLTGISFFSEAQNTNPYSTAIGVRLSAATGVTLKHMILSDAALEGIVATRWNGWYFTGLFEYVKPLSAPDNLYWYIGFGGHAGQWDGNSTPVIFNDPEEEYFILGVDGILGMEYTFHNFPLNLSVDWKPSFNLIEHSGFWGDEVAISIRLAIPSK